MNRRSILTKTGKGLMEATGKTSNLPRDLRNLLKEIDGKVSVSELLDIGKLTEPKLLEALEGLARDGYIREFVAQQDDSRSPVSQSSSGSGDDLDFTSVKPAGFYSPTGEHASLQAQAQEIARLAQLTRAREEAAAKARADAARAKTSADAKPASQEDALARARREAEERQRREAEEKERREMELRAKAEAELAVKRQADEGARREQQEKERRAAEQARAKREAEDQLRREAEERARREIEELTRREIQARKAREEAERLRREEEERARREAEARERRRREEQEKAERAARIEAEARAKVEAELRARREAEERAREQERRLREEEVRRRAEEEARRRQEADQLEALERTLREQEDQARREAEERERAEQARREKEEEQSRAGAEEDERRTEEAAEREREEIRRLREEEKARARAEAQEAERLRKAERSNERAGVEAWRGDEDALDAHRGAAGSAGEVWAKRRPRSLAKQLTLMLVILLAIGVAVLPFVPLDSSEYEKAAGAWLGEPVKIGSLTVSLVPMPRVKFERVAIGKNGEMRIARLMATPELGSLLGGKKILRKLEAENVTLPREYLAALLPGPGKGSLLGVERVTAKGLKIDVPELKLPAFGLDATLSPGGKPASLTLTAEEGRLVAKLLPGTGSAGIEITSEHLPLPIGVDLPMTDFEAKGTVSGNEAVLRSVEGRLFGGRLRGNARVRWTGGWTVRGEFEARQLEAAKVAGPLVGAGTLEGKGAYTMTGLLPERLALNTQLEGTFSVQKGSITNVDMTRLLQGSSTGGGTTLFSEMSGSVSADPNRLLVRQIRMAAGLLHGTGQLEMDPQKNLLGRMQVEIRAQTVQARATLAVSGTLKDPQFRRSN